MTVSQLGEPEGFWLCLAQAGAWALVVYREEMDAAGFPTPNGISAGVSRVARRVILSICTGQKTPERSKRYGIYRRPQGLFTYLTQTYTMIYQIKDTWIPNAADFTACLEYQCQVILLALGFRTNSSWSPLRSDGRTRLQSPHKAGKVPP